jgi:hypothetical protein
MACRFAKRTFRHFVIALSLSLFGFFARPVSAQTFNATQLRQPVNLGMSAIGVAA